MSDAGIFGYWPTVGTEELIYLPDIAVDIPQLMLNRYWQYLNKQDKFFKISEWPQWAQVNMVRPHKSDSQMYNLAYFLIGNGLDPWTTIRWIRSQDYVGGKLIPGEYSAKEHLDMAKVLQKAKAGLLLTGKKRVYDMNLQRPAMM